MTNRLLSNTKGSAMMPTSLGDDLGSPSLEPSMFPSRPRATADPYAEAILKRENALNDAKFANMGGEAIIEQTSGWKPGLKAKFDKALMGKDYDAVREMLPLIPAQYHDKILKMIPGK